MIRRLSEVVAEVRKDPYAAPVTSYGLSLLDSCPNTPGTLIVVGGRTGAGKSYFGLCLLAECSTPGAYVSLEDPPNEVARRVEAMPRHRLSEVLLITPRRSRLSHIAREIEQAFADGHTPRMVVIDYIQLVQYDGETPAWSQTDQIGLTIQELKAVARERGFVLVVLCQLRRPNRDEADHFPTLWDLRDSSNLENSAEVVVLLRAHEDQRLEARVAKNKSGATGGTAFFKRGSCGFLTPITPVVDQEIFGQPSAPVYDLFDEAAA
jgi:replicative DNA helicase